MRGRGHSGAVLIVLLLGILAAVAVSAAGEEQDARRRQVDRLAAGLAADLARRPAVRDHWPGPTVWAERGEAYSCYALALGHAADLAAVGRAMEGDGAPARGADEDLRARWAPVVGGIRAGARTRSVRPPDIDALERFPGLIHALDASTALGWDAIAACGAGDDEQAAEILCDGLLFGADLLALPGAVAEALGAQVLERMTQVLDATQVARLSPGALRLLAQGLAAVDATVSPCTDAILWTALWAAHLPATPGIRCDEALGIEWWTNWRFLFSPDAMCDAAVVELARDAAAADAAASLAWPERWRLLATLAQRHRQSDNPAIRALALGWHDHEAARRRALVHLRLLRLAVALHLGEQPEPLPDPLGPGLLQVEDTAGGWTLRSGGDPLTGSIVREVVR